MIKLDIFSGQKIALVGLGASGIATALSLIAGGADVHAFDDNHQGCDKAEKLGIKIVNLQNNNFDQYAFLVLSPGIPLTHPIPHWSVEKAQKAHIPIVGDIDLFYQQKVSTLR